MDEISYVLWKSWWLNLRIFLSGPVVLTTESKPPEFPAEELFNCDWSVYLWRYGTKGVRSVWVAVEE
jgi:hypothetical protein